MQAYIRSVGAYVPEKVVTNDDLAKTIDTSDEWIYSHTGIHERRIAAEDQAASDLGHEAVKAALANITILDPEGDEISGSDVDLVLLATSTPDYPGLPSTACVVQDLIGAREAGAMDLIAACTGFIYGLETARNFVVAGGAKNVLVIGAEVYSKIINWKDRTTCVLFGDGAGAVLVSQAPEGSPSAIHHSILGSQGDGVKHLLRPAGGSRTPYKPGITPEGRSLSPDERPAGIRIRGGRHHRHREPATGTQRPEHGRNRSRGTPSGQPAHHRGRLQTKRMG
jgi:3-oxoacyl-[acyl-carrier-protein] synthase-3